MLSFAHEWVNETHAVVVTAGGFYMMRYFQSSKNYLKI